MNINIDKIINSIKLDHTYTFHLKEEIMKTFVGQKRVIAELAENLGTFKKSEIIRKLGEHLGNKTRQSPLIIFPVSIIFSLMFQCDVVDTKGLSSNLLILYLYFFFLLLRYT